MLKRSLLLHLFEAFNIQRWNDRIRPLDLTEMEKNAHKMVIAYCLGKHEEQIGKTIDWDKIIKGGIFELLRRIAIADMKSTVYRKIKVEYSDVYKELNTWIYDAFDSLCENESFKKDFRQYLFEENYLGPLEKAILNGAHKYATYWEFQIIKQFNPNGYQIENIEKQIMLDIEKSLSLVGMQKIVTKQKLSSFIDLCGQLRFQVRWGQTPRVPRTSVLGHTLLVATFSYLASIDVNACPRRRYNNYFGGLFHDLPEAVTRDIISPVKGSTENMPTVIGKIEEEFTDQEIYPLLEDEIMRLEIRYFTKDEFSNRIRVERVIEKVKAINSKYNTDNFDPIDGEIIRLSDHLAAFLEAYKSKQFGINSKSLNDGLSSLEHKYTKQKKNVCGISAKSIFEEFAQ